MPWRGASTAVIVPVLIGFGIVMAYVVGPVYGQSLTIPTVAIIGPQPAGVSISAGEADYHVSVERARVYMAHSFLDPRIPKDSMQTVIAAHAQAWLTSLQTSPIRGIQIDPYGRIGVAAQQDLLARRQIATRLATPGLSLNDRAYTYLVAITAFSDTDHPMRLTIAEEYLVGLESLGTAAAYWQHTAHRNLVSAYYILGRSSDIIRHGLRASELLSSVEFVDREHAFNSTESAWYFETVEALTGRSDGQSKIAVLNATFATAAIPPADLVARDSAFYWMGVEYRHVLEQRMSKTKMIGRRGEDIVGNYWVNWPIAGSIGTFGPMPVANGKIHLLEFGSYTCDGCRVAMVHLQRLQDRYSNIQVVTITSTTGAWGLRLVEPEVEADSLRQYYTQRLKIRYPISIWKGKKVLNADDGLTPEDEGPNFRNYPMVGKPDFYIIDGHGTIRCFFSNFSSDVEAEMTKVIEYLLHESA